MKHLVTFLFCLLGLTYSFAQGEANNWYFGRNAGVNFNTNPPTALTDGQLNTNEGCSSISDASGNLLFYTDGRTVYNRQHQIMSNADYFGGNGLLGDPSSTSSGLIIPHPTNPDLFYVFTVDEPHHDNAAAFPNQGPAAQDGSPTGGSYTDIPGFIPDADDGFNNGFAYSLVDMSLDGGLGDVVPSEKNVLLTTYDTTDPEAEKYKCSEKISAVRSSDCESFWVVTHFVDTFYAFRIDENGVETTPVTSTVGPTIPYTSYRRAALGYMKISPDGEKIGIAHNTITYDPRNGTADAGDGGVWLHDFNATTGEVTNSTAMIEGVNAYSVEFSASSNRFYATVRGNTVSNSIQQWDLTAPDVAASRLPISNSENGLTTALQLAPNGKIYQPSFNPLLYVINNPEARGDAVNFSTQISGGAIPLNGRASAFGLPPFIQSIFTDRIDIVNISDDIVTSLPLCEEDSYTLSYDDIVGASYQWFLDDMIIPLANGHEYIAEQPAGVMLPYTEVYTLEVDLNNGDCPLIGTVEVTYNQDPTLNPPENEILCDLDGNGSEDFDVTSKDAEVLGTQDPNTFSASYYFDLQDANQGVNPITTILTITDPIQILVRVQNDDNPDCYLLDNFTVSLLPPAQANPVANMAFCDNDDDGDDTNGSIAFDLTTFDTTILGTQSETNYEVTYHNSQNEADNDMNPIDAPNFVLNNTATIFVRVDFDDSLQCNSQGFASTSFTLSVNPLPEVMPARLVQCQDMNAPNGISQFNLTEANSLIVADTNGFIFNYYLEASLTTQLDETNYSNTQNDQIVFAEVIDESTTCSRVAEVQLHVENRNANDATLEVCGGEFGFGQFTLSNAEADILAGLNPALSIAFYESEEDAFLETSPLNDNYPNTIAFEQVVFARVEDANNECFGISEVTLIVNTPPVVEPDESVIYCVENLPEPLAISSGVIGNPNDYTYSWSPDGQTTETIFTANITTHTVTITNRTTTCVNSRSVTLEASGLAQIIAVDITDLSENNTLVITIAANSPGDYEYALDNENGPYQDEPIFENVTPGVHNIYVRDKNGCGITRSEDIGVLGFMNFFTPNGDGFNDVWRIIGATRAREANALVYIFDRYGKLLKNFPAGTGAWDGTFNDNPMPSSDYWYMVKLQDGRVFKSHFTLKR